MKKAQAHGWGQRIAGRRLPGAWLMAAAAWTATAACAGEAGTNGAWRIAARPAGAAPALPPSAVVLNRESGSGGDAWRCSGEVPGDAPVARASFMQALGAQGWRADKTIPLSAGPRRAELTTWRKRAREAMLVLWETQAGRCAFIVGEDATPGSRSAGARPREGKAVSAAQERDALPGILGQLRRAQERERAAAARGVALPARTPEELLADIARLGPDFAAAAAVDAKPNANAKGGSR